MGTFDVKRAETERRYRLSRRRLLGSVAVATGLVGCSESIDEPSGDEQGRDDEIYGDDAGDGADGDPGDGDGESGDGDGELVDGDDETNGEEGVRDADGGDGGAESDDSQIDHERYSIMEGSEYETTVHVLTAPEEGPTAFVLGGVHGNEVGGIEAAHVATEYEPERGRLVVIPETNRPAVEEETRSGPDGDLNRQFPPEGPTTELAEAVWGVIEAHDPDYLIDMHTSYGIFCTDEGAVGQAVFPAPVGEAPEIATAAVEHVNETYVEPAIEEWLPEEYEIQAVLAGEGKVVSGEATQTMLVAAAARERDVESWITEVTYRDLDLEQQVYLHDRITTTLLAIAGIEVASPLDDVTNRLHQDRTGH